MDIKHRQGYTDLSVRLGGDHLAVVEVKREWTLTWRNRDVLRQAYDYAKQHGAKYVIVTNGDYYAVFDQAHGMTYDENLLAEFRLSALTEADVNFINSLRKK